MKEIWVLSVRTSLPEVCYTFGDMKLEMQGFDSFQAAKAAFREKLKGFAFSKNAMFDGKGHITYLDKYSGYDPEDDEDEDVLTSAVLSKLGTALNRAFSGEDTAVELAPGYYTDWMIGVEVEKDSVSFCGEDDGPINGYAPVLQTNIFSMEKEQEYYLYIDDRFGQDDATSELYMDLRKVKVQ